jgi:hypothetical protein
MGESSMKFDKVIKSEAIKRIILLLIIMILFAFLGCSKKSSPTSSSDDCVRTGAVCKDGTTTDATGSGACSHHGGVDHWICK